MHVCVSKGERPLNLRVTGQRKSANEGETPLGKQLANELKRHNQANTEGKTSGATGVYGNTKSLSLSLLQNQSSIGMSLIQKLDIHSL